ncbi:hypothetical protein [Sphingomonas sp. T9W2]
MPKGISVAPISSSVDDAVGSAVEGPGADPIADIAAIPRIALCFMPRSII